MNNRLGNDDYVKPKKTKQDKLTPTEIKEMLEDYIEVEDISKVPLNTHLRYFSEKKNEKTKKIEKVFRMGGFLVNKNNYDKYVILATAPNTGVINSNAKTWSANTQTSKFYRKLSYAEMKEQYEEEIEDLQEQIALLKKENKKLKSDLKKYKDTK
jgi:predicted RNase H-like nuclease (RuvC/YqgF family)